MAKRMRKRHACFAGVIFLSLLMGMCLRVMADDTCMLTFLGDAEGENTLAAPVIPPEETTSSHWVYITSFHMTGKNFWEGNVVKLALSADNEVVDKNGDPALESDGTLKAGAVPYWAAKDWANPAKPNYVANTDRHIYTYMGSSPDLTDPSNQFASSNTLLTAEVLGNPTHDRSQIIDYVRGADVFDENGNGNTSENRAAILGDVVHSQPLVFRYVLPDHSSTTMVYFGANDGMLHAVLDTQVDPGGTETSYGTEAWAFIPPDQLHRLKGLVEGSIHPYFIDSSPKVFFRDVNHDGIVDASAGDQVILVCGEREGGTSYFALDITDPQKPRFLWRINRDDDASALGLPPGAAPNEIIPQLGETWSEPEFGLVKTSEEDETGTPVFFVGAGYSPDNSAGKAILAIRVSDGSVLAKFDNSSMGTSGMNYAIPSSVTVVDENDNGFVDKVYVGDVGGQMWRVGRFTDAVGDPYPFPQTDENIRNWSAQVLFFAGIAGETPGIRKFFYPPSVALEKGYDLLLMGTGDVDDACNPVSEDRIYAVKDENGAGTLTEPDLVDMTNPVLLPDLDDETADVDRNGHPDQGWYLRLGAGEKVLSEGLLFNKVYYVDTFAPIQGGGATALYALDYKTGQPALFSGVFPHTRGGALWIGNIVPSKPVIVMGENGPKLFFSANKAESTTGSASPGAGILAITPSFPPVNFFYLWWMQL